MLGHVAGWQQWIRVVAALFVVVFDVKRIQLGVVDVQSTAGVVDILTMQRVLGGLGCVAVLHLNESLEFIVFGERDYLENGPVSAKYLIDGVEAHTVQHVLYHGSQDRVLTARLSRFVQVLGHVQSGLSQLVVRVAGISNEIFVV